MSSVTSQSEIVVHPCKICSLPTKTVNFGVVSCRACANFFKRTHLNGTVYVCRQSTGKCTTRRDLPFLCRRCRFDKCLSLGMKLSKKLVQQSTTPLKNQEYSLPVTLGKASLDSLVLEMGDQFNLWYAKRANLESGLWKTKQYHDCFNEIHSPKGKSYFHVTNSFMNDSFSSFLQNTIELCSIVFPEFRKLSPKSQQEICMATSTAARNMECFYLSEKIFPNDDRYIIYSTTSLYDAEHPEAYFCDVKRNKKECINVMKKYAEMGNKLTRTILRNAQFNETEFHAALILLMWSFDLAPWVPEEIIEIGDSIKVRVFKELSRYYRDVLKCDVAFRLGQLMLCVHAMQEVSSLIQEEFRTYLLLGALEYNEPIVQLFLG